MLLLQQLRWPSCKSVCLWRCRFWFDSESGQTKDLKIGVHTSQSTCLTRDIVGTEGRLLNTNTNICFSLCLFSHVVAEIFTLLFWRSFGIGNSQERVTGWALNQGFFNFKFCWLSKNLSNASLSCAFLGFFL